MLKACPAPNLVRQLSRSERFRAVRALHGLEVIRNMKRYQVNLALPKETLNLLTVLGVGEPPSAVLLIVPTVDHIVPWVLG